MGRRRERGMCVDMGTGHQRRKEGKTQKHVKQEELNMRQERKVKHQTEPAFVLLNTAVVC